MKNILYFFMLILLTIVECMDFYKNTPLEPTGYKWWGPEHLRHSPDKSIRPFRVVFEEEAVWDLKQRLINHRPFTPPLENVGFEYGFNTDALERWVQFWAHDYNFNEREMFLNQYPQYKTNIQGLDIHFLWIKPEVTPNADVVPMLFLHGWPGTVRELYESIGYITALNKTRDFGVEIIAPSLPGFGFSDAAVRPGLGSLEIATVLRNLMQRLGFNEYYVQGGDWGARIGANIATLYPEEVLGYHTNMPVSAAPPSLSLMLAGVVNPTLVVDPHLADRIYPLQKKILELVKEFGYLHLQATKPDSIGVAMSDSPAGMLAYLLQLISSGTSKNNLNTGDGGLEQSYTRESLLDIMTIFWMTNSFTSSCRIYKETISIKCYSSGLDGKPTTVPTWTIHAKHEIVYQSPIMLRFKFPNLLHSTVLDDGGHFLALEKPSVLAYDILRAIDMFRRWHEIQK